MHPQCRSTTVPYVRDDEFAYEGTRAARDKDGKIYSVPTDMKYSEWYEKYVKNDPEYLLIEKKYKNRANDKKQLAKYKSVLGSNVPKSLDKFQDLKYTDSVGWETTKKIYKALNVEGQKVFDVAKSGGRHKGTYNDANKKTFTQLNKSIKSHEKQIEEHLDKIKNPVKYVSDWHIKDTREQEGIIIKWNKDIRHNKEMLEIEKVVKKEREIND